MWILLKYQEKLKYHDNCLYFCYVLKMFYEVSINSTLHKKESVSYKPLHLYVS